MPDTDFDAAVAEAARLLARSTLPVIAGHIDDAAAASAAFRLAKAIGGVVDHAAAEASLRDHAILSQTGCMLVSPGEARQRADTFLLVGDRPLRAWPALPDFLLAEGPTHISDVGPKRVLLAFCGKQPGPWQSAVEVVWRQADPDKLPTLLGALRARIAGRPIAASLSGEDIDRLAATLKAARFGVALWCAGELDAMALEMLTGLIKDLNAETRWSGVSVVEDGGAAAATLVSGWTTGFPLRTAFGRGYPEHDPWRFDARRLVQSGEADAIVWIAAPGEAAPAWLGEIPTVELSTQPRRSEAICIAAGVSGLDHDAVVYDQRTGTLVRHIAAEPSGIPNVAAVLDRLTALLP